MKKIFLLITSLLVISSVDAFRLKVKNTTNENVRIEYNLEGGNNGSLQLFPKGIKSIDAGRSCFTQISAKGQMLLDNGGKPICSNLNLEVSVGPDGRSLEIQEIKEIRRKK